MTRPQVTSGPFRPGPLDLAALTFAVGLLLSLAGDAHGQGEAEDAWAPFRFFSGAWFGRDAGVAGIGTGERVFAFIMNDVYLMSISTSHFEPQEQSPTGAVHEDYSIFSYDKLRGKVILREFHSEGFVNQYVLAELGDEGRRFVFESESVENLPSGCKARVTLTILSADQFSEVFELARPGQPHEELLRNHWTRR